MASIALEEYQEPALDLETAQVAYIEALTSALEHAERPTDLDWFTELSVFKAQLDLKFLELKEIVS